MTNETPWYENEAELLGIAKCVLDERKAQRLKLGIPDNTAYFAIDGREATRQRYTIKMILRFTSSSSQTTMMRDKLFLTYQEKSSSNQKKRKLKFCQA